ncbi:hypothetical protein, partial [Planococcus maitriensis]
LIAQYCWRIAVIRRAIRFDLPKLISKFAAIARGCIIDVLLFSFQGSCVNSLNVTATFKYYQTLLGESIVISLFFASRFLLKTRQEIS